MPSLYWRKGGGEVPILEGRHPWAKAASLSKERKKKKAPSSSASSAARVQREPFLVSVTGGVGRPTRGGAS